VVREGYSRSLKEELELGGVGRRRQEEGEDKHSSQREQHVENPGAGRQVRFTIRLKRSWGPGG